MKLRLFTLLILVILSGCASNGSGTNASMAPLSMTLPAAKDLNAAKSRIQGYAFRHQGTLLVRVGPVSDGPGWQQAHLSQMRVNTLQSWLKGVRVDARYAPDLANGQVELSWATP
ncbi:hypothetical protein KUV89_02635 [Marinobacter hydrocarbonoclasticus]|nr:hypothetical protein [Marinobacter nauticus]